LRISPPPLLFRLAAAAAPPDVSISVSEAARCRSLTFWTSLWVLLPRPKKRLFQFLGCGGKSLLVDVAVVAMVNDE
jgi:hypothetical protein